MIRKLIQCDRCGGVIQKKRTESWPTYYQQKGCSQKCGAILREHTKRMAADAAKTVQDILTTWGRKS